MRTHPPGEAWHCQATEGRPGQLDGGGPHQLVDGVGLGQLVFGDELGYQRVERGRGERGSGPYNGPTKQSS